jgi:uncharacterized protein YcbK (DUF882 family)
MNRRDFLKTTVVASSVLMFPNILLAKNDGKFEKSISLYNNATAERFNEIFSADGKYDIDALVRLSYFLRDYNVNEVYPIDINIIEFLHTVQSVSDKKYEFLANSGYRSQITQQRLLNMPNSIAAQDSFHPKGMAIDISQHKNAKIGLRDLSEYARSTELGGVGYYPSRGFMHLDSGRVRSWQS